MQTPKGQVPEARCQACINRRDGFYGSYAPACPTHNEDGTLRPAVQPGATPSGSDDGYRDENWWLGWNAAMRASADAPKIETLYLLHRLLSNKHTLSPAEFRADLAKIVDDAYEKGVPEC